MKAKTNLVLTPDRTRVVEESDPEGCAAFPVAQAGEEIPSWAAKLMRAPKPQVPKPAVKEEPAREQDE